MIKRVSFKHLWLLSVVVLSVMIGSTLHATTKLVSPDDLKEKRIGVLLGTIYDGYSTKTYPKATILQYKTKSDIVLALKTDKIDASIYTYESLPEIFQSNDDIGLLGKPLFSFPIALGFNKQNDTLREKFNNYLREIKKNGVHDEMISRWITNGEVTMPEIKNSKKNGTLTAGIVSDKGLPFMILKNNQLAGFDVELAERFAAYLGKELKMVDMEFGGLIPAVASNKIDFIASTLMITEERKKLIGFSDEYYNLHAAAFALKKNMPGSGGGATAPSLSFYRSVANSFRSNIIEEDRWKIILDGLKTTVTISVLATIFGTLLGSLVCFMRMSKNVMLSLPAKVYISILRGTPVLVFLMLIFYVVFASVSIDPVLVAVLAFGMNFAAYAAEIFRSGIEGIEKGQTEAGISLGFNKVKTFLFIVLPQTIRRIFPVFKGEFISLVKMTSIVGYIAVQDLTKASDIIRSRTFDAFFPLIMVAILYFLISWFLLLLLELIERKIDPKSKIKLVPKA
ncbi:MAG: ABC transporter substrate-binding protein/permease [Chlorobium sp.]